MDPRFERLSPEQQREYLQLKQAADALARENPLQRFHACAKWCGSPACPAPSERNPLGGRPQQNEYMTAMDRIVLMAAGNRFGKTTANVVWAIIQHTPDEMLPDRLKEFKRERPEHWQHVPVMGRYIAPSEKALLGIVIPELQRWLPDKILRGGRWDKAYTDKYKVLHFHDGGRLEFYTSEQEAKVMVGTALDYVIFDEPTTEAIWGENWARLTDKVGTARFGLTPVNMVGGGIGWLYRKIYKKGLMGEPYEGTTLIPRVLRATTYDNPDLTDQMVEEFLAIYDPDEREARKTGEFVAFGGLIYPAMKRFRTKTPLDPHNPDHREMVSGQSVVVGIDPSYRRAAVVWVAFNDQNQGLIFQVKYVRKTDPMKLYTAIIEGNTLWGLKQPPYYVMDPYAGGQHGMLSGSEVTMRSELQQMGLYTHAPKILNSQAIVYGRVLNIWRRMQEGSFAVADAPSVDPEFWLEAEEYRLNDREDGVFEVVKEYDDAMDGMAYAFTARPWAPRPKVPKRPSEDYRTGEGYYDELGRWAHTRGSWTPPDEAFNQVGPSPDRDYSEAGI
jgi:hypothetical protein